MKNVASLFDGPSVPGNMPLDVRLGWRPGSSLELALVGQNLLDRGHPEFAQEVFGRPAVEVPRSVYLRVDCAY